MKNKLQDWEESVQAQPLVMETLRQLEAAKRAIEFLRVDAAKARHGYNPNALELDQSRTLANLLASQVRKHESSFAYAGNLEIEGERLEKIDSTNDIEIEFSSLRSEVELLRSAIETAETKFQEERIQNIVKVSNAYELIERIRLEMSQRESELEKKKVEIEELKEKLMDKENELQGILNENQRLNLKLEKSVSLSSKREHDFKKELKRLDEYVAVLKGEMMDKETLLQSISEENEMLKLEINKRYANVGLVQEKFAAEIEAAKAAERGALMKLGMMMDEVERSNSKAARVVEQLEAAQAVNTEKEAELKIIKVQCDQWRKAAEAGAAMFSTENNGKITKRSMSMDNNNVKKSKYSSFCDEIDDWSDLQSKKNGNVLKKFGVLWKKSQRINC